MLQNGSSAVQKAISENRQAQALYNYMVLYLRPFKRRIYSKTRARGYLQRTLNDVKYNDAKSVQAVSSPCINKCHETLLKRGPNTIPSRPDATTVGCAAADTAAVTSPQDRSAGSPLRADVV